jgi:hypothetical protein
VAGPERASPAGSHCGNRSHKDGGAGFQGMASQLYAHPKPFVPAPLCEPEASGALASRPLEHN